MHEDSREAQDSFMLYHCLKNLLSDTAQKQCPSLHVWQKRLKSGSPQAPRTLDQTMIPFPWTERITTTWDTHKTHQKAKNGSSLLRYHHPPSNSRTTVWTPLLRAILARVFLLWYSSTVYFCSVESYLGTVKLSHERFSGSICPLSFYRSFSSTEPSLYRGGSW